MIMKRAQAGLIFLMQAHFGKEIHDSQFADLIAELPGFVMRRRSGSNCWQTIYHRNTEFTLRLWAKRTALGSEDGGYVQ